jgi:hypothetical protein
MLTIYLLNTAVFIALTHANFSDDLPEGDLREKQKASLQ